MLKPKRKNVDTNWEHFTKGQDIFWGLGVGYIFAVSDNTDMFMEFAYLKGTQQVMENLEQLGNGDGQSSTRNQSYSLRVGVRL